jgi:superfamily II DNA or RNA helicase
MKLIIEDEINAKFVDMPADLRRILHQKYKIFNPANRFIPSVRLGRWDGKIAFFTLGGATYINLLPEILEFLENKNVEIELIDNRTYNTQFEFDSVDSSSYSHILWPPGHELAGQPVMMRESQVEPTNIFLRNRQGIQSLATGLGKSLITAILADKVGKYGRSLLIVPNKDLIVQTEKYYQNLNLNCGVYYGDRKDFGRQHTICTWQSLHRLFEKPLVDPLIGTITIEMFLQNMVCVISDECHGIKYNILSSLLNGPLAKIPIRWALTGTIPKEEFDRMALTISIGQVLNKVTASELQEAGILSNCDIKIRQLQDYTEYTTYSSELEYLVGNPDRLQYLAKHIAEIGQSGNTLVLVGRKKTGKELEKLIPGSIFLSGLTKNTIRKEHYDEVATSNNKIIIATSGIAAVGIDIPRLFNLVFIEPGKSYVKTIQSVGRGLRKAHDKDKVSIYDYCSSCKFSKRHLARRKVFYKESNYPFTIEKIDWMNDK